MYTIIGREDCFWCNSARTMNLSEDDEGPMGQGIFEGRAVTINMTKDKIEFGSKWVAKVDHPSCAAILTGDEVVVAGVDMDSDIYYYKHLGEHWYSHPSVWHDHFKPYVEEGVQEDFTLGYFDYPDNTLAKLSAVSDGARVHRWGTLDCPDIDDTVDNVNNPSHYGQGKIEAIEYIKDSLSKEEYIGYLRGNIAKYLHRWRYKNGLEDLKKAQWYLERLIEEVE